jgi:hypothetical protein
MGWAVAATVLAGGSVVTSVVSATQKSKPSAPKIEIPEPTDTGKVTENEAKEVSRKRLYRLGLIGTSPTGLTGLGLSNEPLASARLR